MKGEIPVFTRCCFCFPLRYGLLVWGYLKLTADAFIITLFLYSMISSIMYLGKITGSIDDLQSRFCEDMILPVIALAVFIADFLVTIVFIVGGHQKNLKLIRAFYFISIAMWIFTLMVTIVTLVLFISNSIFMGIYIWFRFMLTFAFHFLALVIQTYFIFLLRSEIIKLKNIGEFRFVNHAAEAECTMKIEDVAVTAETETRQNGQTCT